MEEKTPKYTKRKPRKKFPVWLPSHSPVYENGGRLFFGVRKHRKQTGPTLGGTGALFLWGKEIQGWVPCGRLNCRDCELYTCELSRSSTKADRDTG